MGMLKNLRDRLSERDKRYFRLAVWSCLLVWMLFFSVYSVVFARYARGVILSNIGGTWGSWLGWITPVWIVFTSLLIIVLIARYANKKLRG